MLISKLSTAQRARLTVEHYVQAPARLMVVEFPLYAAVRRTLDSWDDGSVYMCGFWSGSVFIPPLIIMAPVVCVASECSAAPEKVHKGWRDQGSLGQTCEETFSD